MTLPTREMWQMSIPIRNCEGNGFGDIKGNQCSDAGYFCFVGLESLILT